MGGRLFRGTEESDKSGGVGLFNVNVPTNEWISLIGASAEPNENQLPTTLQVYLLKTGIPYISASSRARSPSSNF